MLTQYRYTVEPQETGRIVTVAQGYQLYSWLLRSVPPFYGSLMHQDGEKPVSQYLYSETGGGRTIWTCSCLDQSSHLFLSSTLEQLREAPLSSGTLKLTLSGKLSARSAEELLRLAADGPQGPFFKLFFRSPTSFKHEGEYSIFPDTHFILQNLMGKWNLVFPEARPLGVEDLEDMESGLKIVNYSLHSVRFTLKKARIPGFTGWITVRARLPEPRLRLWRSLLQLARFSGIGIKTTLGMGGVEVTAGQNW